MHTSGDATGQLVATSSLAAGEELTISYLEGAGGWGVARRRRRLQALYGFRCGCHRCARDAGEERQ